MLIELVVAMAAITNVQEQNPTSPPATLEVDSVEVVGSRLEDAAQDFVRTVNVEPPLGTLPGRWTKPLCISVANFRAPWGRFMVDGVTKRATDVGLNVSGPGCRPNVLIVATDDGPQMADAMVRNDRRRFRPPIDHSSHDLSDLDDFRRSDAAVRWWQVTYPRNLEQGGVVGGRGRSEERLGGQRSTFVPKIAVRNPSLIAPTIRYDIETVTVVVDLSKTDDVPMSALADYIALVTLAQIDPRERFDGQSTILNMFDEPNRYASMTDWDLDYMHAVYDADLTRNSVRGHQAEVARALVARRQARFVSQPEKTSE
ncbi:hypothetical protein [Brevundimonas sp. G8]|uniref:hypothetical protein n=1 Tax=Brevundimonas sp. G8 TaxID=1350776 RepID=UPI0012F3EC61|nr:hypothetical protein [Brevundimonas sp. G8]VXB46824.1 conserved hypothetical protein [Brevundimonas sp. G8]